MDCPILILKEKFTESAKKYHLIYLWCSLFMLIVSVQYSNVSLGAISCHWCSSAGNISQQILYPQRLWTMLGIHVSERDADVDFD